MLQASFEGLFYHKLLFATSKISFFMLAYLRLLLLITMVFRVIVITVMCIMGSGKLNSVLCIYISSTFSNCSLYVHVTFITFHSLASGKSY
jgi:hypothetical protein